MSQEECTKQRELLFQIANELGLKIVVVQTSQMAEGDLIGLPKLIVQPPPKE